MSRRSLWGWSLASLALVAACAEQSPPPTGPLHPSFSVTGPPWDIFELCKQGTAATFDVVIAGAASTVSLNAGECRELTGTAAGNEVRGVVTVTEQAQAGVIQLDSIVIDSARVGGISGTEKRTN